MRKLVCLLALGALFLFPSFASADCGLCGDMNGDGSINIADLVAIVSWLNDLEDVPPCPIGADIDCSGQIAPIPLEIEYARNILMNYMFYGGPAPCDPEYFGPCGD